MITPLSAALNINYNISFMGSICEPDEKIESRDTLIAFKRKMIEVRP